MAGSTPIYGIPYPESSDLVANYPALGEGLADKLEDKLPTLAATAPTSPSVGQVWIDSTGSPIGKVWDGSAWTIFSGAGAANFSDTATGTYTDGGIDYKYITYTGSGTLTVTTAGLADILVVGGGGAGSSGDGGGGGAGGMLVAPNAYLPAGSLTVTVGAGGAVVAGQVNNNGNASHIGNYIAPGGGAGGRGGASAGGFNGGSGGGGGGTGTVTGGSGLSLVGNNGGAGVSGTGGGGGGAGAAGNAGNVSSGTGGAGLSNSYTGSSVTYAKGGDGENNNNTIVNGSANTGDGGKGVDGGAATASSGGSGIVIIRVVV